eukprot:TRINITY_DN7288_c0_g1_i1.p1 TRINITY_DN7288_c0_g1~~TRINITY_DN7288_c0_g1_i1.p1  ORF type:complete len:529 (+),score=111.70 TRINITY_DN7288_c0_g1_i1:81-1667(+)
MESHRFPSFCDQVIVFNSVSQPFASVKECIREAEEAYLFEENAANRKPLPKVCATLIKEIGQGAHAKIYTASVLGNDYAVKVIRKDGEAAPDLQIGSADDLDSRALYDFQYLATLTQSYGGVEYIFTLMPLGTKTYLERFKIAIELGGLRERSNVVLRGALGGLKYLNFQCNKRKDQAAHRDIRPENLLFIGDNCYVIDGSSSLLVKSYDEGSAEFQYDLARLIQALIRPVVAVIFGKPGSTWEDEVREAENFLAENCDARRISMVTGLNPQEAQTLLDVYNRKITVKEAIKNIEDQVRERERTQNGFPKPAVSKPPISSCDFWLKLFQLERDADSCVIPRAPPLPGPGWGDSFEWPKKYDPKDSPASFKAMWGAMPGSQRKRTSQFASALLSAINFTCPKVANADFELGKLDTFKVPVKPQSTVMPPGWKESVALIHELCWCDELGGVQNLSRTRLDRLTIIKIIKVLINATISSFFGSRIRIFAAAGKDKRTDGTLGLVTITKTQADVFHTVVFDPKISQLFASIE